MSEIRGVFFDLYGTLLVYGDLVAAWRDFRQVVDTHLRRQGFVLEDPALNV